MALHYDMEDKIYKLLCIIEKYDVYLYVYYIVKIRIIFIHLKNKNKIQ